MDNTIFLVENRYIDFSSTIIQYKVKSLFCDIDNDVEKTKIAYEYGRDEIPHSFDIQSDIITAKASNEIIELMRPIEIIRIP